MELSPSACAYLKNYLVARFVQQCIVYKKDSVAGKALIEQTIGIPFDTLQKWGGYGDDYLVTLYARKLLPPQVQEKYMAGRLLYYCQEKYFETAQKLYEDYAGYFPNGSHAILCRQRFEGLKKLLEQSRQNSEIVFRPHAENTASLEELIAPYKGKVVYLDIWGTWCGPCREEMGFAPALKEHFAGREIVFLYLDMDEATQDSKWKNYVSIEKVTGHHLRMDGQRMEKIWEALLHTVNVPRYYPSYFIFDRDGKLIAGKARRPSEKEELYKQLEEIVNK
jgi:thiol-disulfide isomerase/thioredoxin